MLIAVLELSHGDGRKPDNWSMLIPKPQVHTPTVGSSAGQYHDACRAERPLLTKLFTYAILHRAQHGGDGVVGPLVKWLVIVVIDDYAGVRTAET